MASYGVRKLHISYLMMTKLKCVSGARLKCVTVIFHFWVTSIDCKFVSLYSSLFASKSKDPGPNPGQHTRSTLKMADFTPQLWTMEVFSWLRIWNT